MTEDFEKIRDIDLTVLTLIDDGKDDVQKITEATTLPNYKVTYSFQKLEDLGLITVTKPDGTVERIINGQKRVFQHPKTAKLTENGRQYLEQNTQEDLGNYEDLSHRELVQRVHQLEDQVADLERKLELFREQVQGSL